MKITISGLPGSGKSSVGKLLAKSLKYKYYGAGLAKREYAKKNGLTIDELNELSKKDPYSDYLVDKFMAKIANSQNIIYDAWLGFYFIPDSIKIWLHADARVRAQRIYDAKRTEEIYKNPKTAIKKLDARFKNSEKRYKKLYQIYSISDPDLFDILIDTTNLTSEQVCIEILEQIKRLKNRN